MSFMDGMMGGGDGTGYGSAIDTITLTDKKANGVGKIGNATATPTQQTASTTQSPYTRTAPRATQQVNGGGTVRPTTERVAAPVNGGASVGPLYIPPEYVMPDGTVVDDSGGIVGVVTPDGTVVDPGTGTPVGVIANGGASGPSPSMDGSTEFSPSIGPEVNGAPPEKKRNWGLILGGGLLVAGALGGLGYAIYKSQE